MNNEIDKEPTELDFEYATAQLDAALSRLAETFSLWDKLEAVVEKTLQNTD